MSIAVTKDWENFLESLAPEATQTYTRIKRATEVLTVEPEPQVGPTPKEVIWTKNKAKLYRYTSNEPSTHKVPLLLVYALINKPYILDLKKGSSLIEYLVNRGFDVYLLDWGTPSYEDKNMKLDNYILDYIPRAVNKVLRTSEAKEVSVLGYCMGGTMTSIFASLHPELPIRNLIFMTSPFDFSDSGLFDHFLDERYFNLDQLVETMGIIPPEMIDFGNKMLKPIPNFCGPYVNLVNNSDNEKFINNWKLMQKWLSDGIPFPGEAYRQWIRDFYQQNKLIKGELVIRGKKVDLKNIKANVLNIAAERDHIAMPHQVEALMDNISSKDKEYVVLPTGHVSVTIGSRAVKHTYPKIGDWLAEHSN